MNAQSTIQVAGTDGEFFGSLFGLQGRLARSETLSRQDLGVLVLAMGSPQTVQAGDTLVRSDEAATHLVVLADGWAMRTLDGPGGRQITAILLPGDVCNLDALTARAPEEGAEMLMAGSILTLPVATARSLARERPAIAEAFLAMALAERAAVADLAHSLGQRDARERLARVLCGLAERLDADEFAWPLTQMQLSQALGITNVHVNRVLSSFRSQELIALDRRTIRLNRPALQRIAYGEPETARPVRHVA